MGSKSGHAKIRPFAKYSAKGDGAVVASGTMEEAMIGHHDLVSSGVLTSVTKATSEKGTLEFGKMVLFMIDVGSTQFDGLVGNFTFGDPQGSMILDISWQLEPESTNMDYTDHLGRFRRAPKSFV